MVFSGLFIIASLFYKASSLVIYQTTSKEYLNSLGYQYLGEKHKFEHWKVNYKLFHKSLSKSVYIFKNISNEVEGGYLL
ncbi:hypothetical protein A6V39_04495 [Candidatus Mycoplasma haematobovis]|uniref:Uncharacterized protein n=1 Tax=Candidatus Mycoplasma haematobovis TaxID=432608 RepID=A0A1A9QDI2_9MOLU|nr:hypothetical protein [Candidatus Mycoplasma haematobovis]OAL10144.1 hypothetical protein A6V39_04495 [Candidatus Mycoplasma haematobovis]